MPKNVEPAYSPQPPNMARARTSTRSRRVRRSSRKACRGMAGYLFPISSAARIVAFRFVCSGVRRLFTALSFCLEVASSEDRKTKRRRIAALQNRQKARPPSLLLRLDLLEREAALLPHEGVAGSVGQVILLGLLLVAFL